MSALARQRNTFTSWRAFAQLERSLMGRWLDHMIEEALTAIALRGKKLKQPPTWFDVAHPEFKKRWQDNGPFRSQRACLLIALRVLVSQKPAARGLAVCAGQVRSCSCLGESSRPLQIRVESHRIESR